jgi:hypothetical protein
MAAESLHNDRKYPIGEVMDEELTAFMPEQGLFLPELPPSPWRSLGRRLDYSTWQDRERFMELDAVLLTHQELWEARRIPIRERNRRIISEADSSLLSAA